MENQKRLRLKFNKVSRRELLFKLVPAGAVVGIGADLLIERLYRYFKSYDPLWRIEADSDTEHISFDEAAALTKRFDAAYNRLPRYQPEATRERLVEWAAELLPMYVVQGAVDSVTIPQDLEFYLFPDGRSFMHVLGRSDCASFAIFNLRYANPISSWYRRESLPFTEGHELAHIVQGEAVCSIPPNDPRAEEKEAHIEVSAQVITVEAMAALALTENVYAFYALLDELRSMASSVAWATAIREKRIPDYENLRRQLSPGALTDARIASSSREWSNKEKELMEILTRYNESVFLVIMASQKTDGVISGLALQPHFEANPVPSYTPRDFVIDDTLDLLGRLEEVVEDYRQKINNGEIILK